MKKFIALSLLGLTLVFGIYNCSSSASSEVVKYTGPGSFYDITLNNGDSTFTLIIKESASAPTDLTVNGTFVRHTTGFLTLTVVSATGTEAPAAGETANAFEIPGYAFILKPTSGDEVVPMLISGACPTSNFDANWLIAQTRDSADASSPTQDWFGTFTYAHSAPSATVTSKYALEGLTPVSGSSALTVSGCNEGILSLDESGTIIDLWLTSNGGVMVRNQTDNGTILALPKDTVALADMAGTYSGLAVEGQTVGGDDIFPVKVVIAADGTGTASKILNIETDALESGSADLSLALNPSIGDGWLTGTIDSSASIACAASTDVASSGKNAMFCVGQSPGNEAEHFIVMLVSR